MVRHLVRVVGVGVETADMLVNEVLSRPMRDRKAVGALRRPDGLAGRERREAAGTRACQSRQRPGPPRHGPAGLALSVVSEGERTGPVVPGPPLPIAVLGTRKTMIVALARKLLIALWRFVTTGETLEGVILRPAG